MNNEAKRVALITGASSGIGKDFALQLLAEGYVVYGAARRVERMGEIEAAGGVVIAMDVTEDVTMTAAIERIIREQGRLDVLINNAGYGQMGALEDVPMEAARRQLEVNLIGVARLNQLVLPHMRSRRSGKIVNISTTGGKCAGPLGGWYFASKHALEGYSDSLRMEVQQFGIDVIVIEPGGIDTEWGPIAYGSAQEYSGQGAYSPLVTSMLNSPTLKRKLPPPRIITDLLLKALKSKRPRTRYHGGAMAGLILFLKRFLPDRMLDRVIMKAIK
ncbi:oxidoreductase [Tunturiibacter lichenicola]|uniref:oxidoreductase n=1 Tax=Tunturiibacter lichenicola TaxID=2051959 RepID=UPI0021B2E742|nr:oxidoreductase [Edaphobacter lichenicola]